MHSKTIILSLGTVKVAYRIVEISQETRLEDCHCIRCDGNIALVAEVLQWGFWEDTHLYFTTCERCGFPICFKQAMVIDWTVTIPNDGKGIK